MRSTVAPSISFENVDLVVSQNNDGDRTGYSALPVGAAIEAWSFGTLSKVIEHGERSPGRPTSRIPRRIARQYFQLMAEPTTQRHSSSRRSSGWIATALVLMTLASVFFIILFAMTPRLSSSSSTCTRVANRVIVVDSYLQPELAQTVLVGGALSFLGGCGALNVILTRQPAELNRAIAVSCITILMGVLPFLYSWASFDLENSYHRSNDDFSCEISKSLPADDQAIIFETLELS